jgi:glycerol transport system ATP-binding protein
MSLVLEQVRRSVDNQLWIDDASLRFEPGSFNVLLGRTLAGKTSLMRLMAGLDRPDSGRVLMDGEDVTGRPVRLRNVSMVYQQFINYPTSRCSRTSPRRCARRAWPNRIRSGGAETAEMLRIEKFLQRLPLELSGGQQQRTAMARALVKDASLILFDEPLVNLDYKLREELRQEMRELFAARHTIAVYATTEPNEALALGGTTTMLHEGRVIQSGPPPRCITSRQRAGCRAVLRTADQPDAGAHRRQRSEPGQCRALCPQRRPAAVATASTVSACAPAICPGAEQRR